ncbi:protein preli-like [Aedes aegypti]|uniref:PRELI/MSF1 domain-containing protein n=1 Tax=Aedes aegypti TaxID=7159 RepID=A0A8W7J1P6_AEDAE|nr:protein preli-like [Aedes aegypti]XP_021712719.1 protein preli-like [Aedes aegypti]
MAKYYENTTTFNYSWEQVTQCFWNRYPNPFSLHVLSEDTVCREIKNGKLHSKRLLTKTNRVPKWGERFFKAKSVNILEESVVDPKERVLVTYTRNIGFNKIMVSVLHQVKRMG